MRIRPIKNRPELGSAGIGNIPGLFSELFNVAASRPAQMTTEQYKNSGLQPLRQDKRLVNGEREYRSAAKQPCAVVSHEREEATNPSKT
jgi:hypothetical protein